eukprot:4837603-Prymnesium_polylepis.2
MGAPPGWLGHYVCAHSVACVRVGLGKGREGGCRRPPYRSFSDPPAHGALRARPRVLGSPPSPTRRCVRALAPLRSHSRPAHGLHGPGGRGGRTGSAGRGGPASASDSLGAPACPWGARAVVAHA